MPRKTSFKIKTKKGFFVEKKNVLIREWHAMTDFVIKLNKFLCCIVTRRSSNFFLDLNVFIQKKNSYIQQIID